MPRDDDRNRGGRPPGRGSGRGGPPRGKRFAGDRRGRDDDGPRVPRKVGGRAYRKAHGDAPRNEGRDDRAGGKRFGSAKSGGRPSGAKRSFGPKRGGGIRKEGDRPKFDSSRDDRATGSAGRNRGPRKFDSPKFDKPRFSRDRGERVGNERPRDERRRNDRVTRSAHAWRDHPRSEGAGAPSDRHEEAPAREPRREFQKRPAFGGRGAYRERKPFARDARRESDAAAPPPKKSGERIAKRIARAGLCSRREAEAWIRGGRVVVNGRVIESPALDVNARDIVAVDGVPLPQPERTRLFLYHKPRGLVTTHDDPEGRQTIFDVLPKNLPRLVSIGRLDFNTEGLLLLTNDGGLKRTLELPDTGWLRRYRVRAHGAITQGQLDQLRGGIEVEGVRYGPIEVTLDSAQGSNVWISFAMREGKNREVRNVLGSLGLEVNRLIRVSYGPFQLGELAEGEVIEVRGRTLRDQLGTRIAEQAGADFSLPLRAYGGDGDEAAAPAKPRDSRREPSEREERPKPRGRAGLIADSKGRRVLVQRIGGDDVRDDRGSEEREGRRGRHGFKQRRPPGRYKGKRERPPRDE